MDEKIEVMIEEETNIDGKIEYIIFSKKGELWDREGTTTDKSLVNRFLESMGKPRWIEVEIPVEILKRRLADGDISVEEYTERRARL